MNSQQAPNLYLITGDDEFQVRYKSTEILQHLCGKVPEDNPNLEIYHGDSRDLKPEEVIGELIYSLKTPPFFGDAKVIVLKRFNFSTTKDDVIKKALKQLADVIKDGFVDNVILILEGKDLDKRSALYNNCKKNGVIYEFYKMKVGDSKLHENLRTLIYTVVKKKNLTISYDAVDFLTLTLGADAGRVIHEIDKVAAYVYPSTSITVEDCRDICSVTPEAAGWAFAEALAARDLKKSLDTLNILYGALSGSSAIGILFPVINTFQGMVSVKVSVEKLNLPSTIQYPAFKSSIQTMHPADKDSMADSLITKMHPFKAFKLYKSSQSFDDKKLSQILTELLNVNQNLVSGGANPRIAFELLAIKICQR